MLESLERSTLVMVRRMAVAAALATALVGGAVQIAQATLVPRKVLTEELGWFT